jgi:hypothetical protein
MAQTKPRLFRVGVVNEVMFHHAGRLYRVGPNEVVDFIPPDAIGWLTEQRVITELREGKADIVVAGATDAPTTPEIPVVESVAPAAEPLAESFAQPIAEPLAPVEPLEE